jgi:hypothetical protein
LCSGKPFCADEILPSSMLVVTTGSAELVLDLVEPLEVRLENAPGKAVVEHEVALALGTPATAVSAAASCSETSARSLRRPRRLSRTGPSPAGVLAGNTVVEQRLAITP